MTSTAVETVYISGPMKGMPDRNREAFAAAERILRARGYATINPHDLSPERIPGELDADYYERCMDIDLAALERVDAIFLLPGWQSSSGALREYARAREIGLEVLHQ